jgi:hypothetical protein
MVRAYEAVYQKPDPMPTVDQIVGLWMDEGIWQGGPYALTAVCIEIRELRGRIRVLEESIAPSRP